MGFEPPASSTQNEGLTWDLRLPCVVVAVAYYTHPELTELVMKLLSTITLGKFQRRKVKLNFTLPDQKSTDHTKNITINTTAMFSCGIIQCLHFKNVTI